MTHIKKAGPPAVVVALIAGIVGYVLGCANSTREEQSQANAEEKPGVGAGLEQPAEKSALLASPVKALGNREMYYPGSEALAPDEMRVVACGTGMPNARPKQAAACFLVELGNGEKFIFDAGLGCAERIAAMQIPYDYLDKVFIGHLHADHIGDLDALWIGGSISNRQRPLRVWGPSGAEEKLGTEYMVERMKEMYVWDQTSRLTATSLSSASPQPLQRPASPAASRSVR